MTVPRRIVPPPTLPSPPRDWNASYMEHLVSTLQRFVSTISNPATLRGGMLNLSATQFNAYNLKVGDVWIDVNHLVIMRAGDVGFVGESLTLSGGTVTVTT